MKYYAHVGANQSMVILHVVVNIQHTLHGQFLAWFKFLINSKSRFNDMHQETLLALELLIFLLYFVKFNE